MIRTLDQSNESLKHVPSNFLRYDQDRSTVHHEPRKTISGFESSSFGAESLRTRRPNLHFLEPFGKFGSREQWLILASCSFLSNLYRYGKNYLSLGRGNSSLMRVVVLGIPLEYLEIPILLEFQVIFQIPKFLKS